MEISWLMQCILIRNNIIKLTRYDETKKRAGDSQLVIAKENSNWAIVDPATDTHQAPTHRLKFYIIESDAWPVVPLKWKP